MRARSRRLRIREKSLRRNERAHGRPRARLSRTRPPRAPRTEASAENVSRLSPRAYVESVKGQNEVQKARDHHEDITVLRSCEFRLLPHGEARRPGPYI